MYLQVTPSRLSSSCCRNSWSNRSDFGHRLLKRTCRSRHRGGLVPAAEGPEAEGRGLEDPGHRLLHQGLLRPRLGRGARGSLLFPGRGRGVPGAAGVGHEAVVAPLRSHDSSAHGLRRHPRHAATPPLRQRFWLQLLARTYAVVVVVVVVEVAVLSNLKLNWHSQVTVSHYVNFVSASARLCIYMLGPGGWRVGGWGGGYCLSK